MHDVSARSNLLISGHCAWGIPAARVIAASTLAPRAALETIVRSRPRSLNEIMKSGALLRWQAELVQDAVEKTLRAAP